VDAKGDLSEALGHPPAGFQPEMVQTGLSGMGLHGEEAFHESLRIFFKVPRLAQMTSLARVFDFVATGVPGPRDMLMVGKIAYEERRRESGGRPVWDLIVVDCTSTGQILPQLTAARSMKALVHGGMIRSQVDFVDAVVSDRRRTALCITALPEEMPVAEALDLHDRVVEGTGIALGACFLNRTLEAALSPRQRGLLDRLSAPSNREAVATVLGGGVGALVAGVELADALSRQAQPFARRLALGMSVPVLGIPLVATRPGLATTRAVAAALEGAP